jgi:hypothetical protein
VPPGELQEHGVAGPGDDVEHLHAAEVRMALQAGAVEVSIGLTML